MTDDNGVSASPTGLPMNEAASASSPSVGIPDAGRVTLAREMAIRDAALLEAAKWAEESSLLEIRGIMSRRKRDREDAALRIETAKNARARVAHMIRARVANRSDCPGTMLLDIADGAFGHRRGLSTSDLSDAFLLARRGLVEISVEATIAGSWNCTRPETMWRCKLSEKGEREVANLRAVDESDAPETQQEDF